MHKKSLMGEQIFNALKNTWQITNIGYGSWGDTSKKNLKMWIKI
jgi:hypothetical protein